jgi:dsRNA-specific ribonuclease
MTNKMENSNPIIELAELVQRQYGKNIETRVLGKTGADHMPTVSVEIELQNK